MTARGRRAATAAAVAGATAWAFWPALRGGFVWDDKFLILRNTGYRALDGRHLAWMFTTQAMGHYQPLVWLSYALDYKLWGLNPLGFHLTNVLLQAAAAALFFLLARDVLEDGLAAAAAALFFAVHPLRVESVAWIAERRDLLCGVFFFATLLAWRRGRRALAASLHALALLSKVSAAPAPLVLMLLEWLPRGRRPALLDKWPLFLLSAAAAAEGLHAHRRFLALNTPAPLSFRLVQAVVGAAFYLQKTLLPAGLAPYYPRPPALGALARRLPAALAWLAATAALLPGLGVGRRAQAALWGYYLLMIGPVLGLVENGAQLYADRYSYLACLGWALLLGAGAARLAAAARRSRVRQGVAAAGAAVLLLALMLAARAQTSCWRDDAAFWARVSAVESAGR